MVCAAHEGLCCLTILGPAHSGLCHVSSFKILAKIIAHYGLCRTLWIVHEEIESTELIRHGPDGSHVL